MHIIDIEKKGVRGGDKRESERQIGRNREKKSEFCHGKGQLEKHTDIKEEMYIQREIALC